MQTGYAGQAQTIGRGVTDALAEDINSVMSDIRETSHVVKCGSEEIAVSLDGAVPQQGENPAPPSPNTLFYKLVEIRTILRDSNAELNRAKRALGI